VRVRMVGGVWVVVVGVIGKGRVRWLVDGTRRRLGSRGARCR